MTVQSNNPVVNYTGNGVTTSFNAPSNCISPPLVLKTTVATGAVQTLVLNSDYTLTSVGGLFVTVSLFAAPTSAYTLSIQLNEPFTQLTHWVEGDPFPAASHEAAADHAVLLAQQLQGMIQALATPGLTIAQIISQINSSGNISAGAVSSLGPLTGELPMTQLAVNNQFVTPQRFGAKGDGVTDDSAAFTAMFATGRPWHIPYTPNGYLVNSCFIVTATGACEGQLKVPAGFFGTSGRLITVSNPNYGAQVDIFGLSTWSTDLRPNVYDNMKCTVGIYVGPTGLQQGVTNVAGVNLWNCSAQRFSVGLHVACFDVNVWGGQYVQNDHGILIYSADAHLNTNQINDVALHGVTSNGSNRYSLRLGTTGGNPTTMVPTMTLDYTQGVNVVIDGACNFDMPVLLDNMIGLKYEANYHELPTTLYSAGNFIPGLIYKIASVGTTSFTAIGASANTVGLTFTATGVGSGTGTANLAQGAVVVGSAGVNSVRNITINGNFFNGYYFSVDVMNQTPYFNMAQNTYNGILYSALRVFSAETQTSIKYESGLGIGTPTWSGGTSEVQLNYSGGISQSQLTFAGISISAEFLVNGVQMAPGLVYATGWYPFGQTLDGYRNNSSIYGRFRSGGAIQTSIPGTQAGAVFKCTDPTKAALFNGGDRITTSPGGTNFVKSVDQAAGTVTLDAAVSATSLSHQAATFQAVNVWASAMPTTGSWLQGDCVHNTAPTNAAGQPAGWLRVTTGSGNVLNTDWRVFGVTT